MTKKMIAPSILAANFGNLQQDIEMVNDSRADWFHLDVMDGVFVPNISFGIPVIKAIKEHSKKPLDVHLMIVKPEKFIKEFKNAGADILTVHYEACTHLHRTVQEIKNAGMKVGVSLNPHTPISVLEDIIKDIDVVLIMSVNPGFGGQSFIENTYKKVKQLKKIIIDSNSDALIEVDGGVSDKNISKLSKLGVDVFVAGSFVFNNNNPKEVIEDLKDILSF